jgi:hypothetical protein
MDPKAIPVLLTVCGLATSIMWGTYGLLTTNWFVFGPNATGIVLSVIQLGVAAYVQRNAHAYKSVTTIDSGDYHDPLHSQLV